VSGTPTPEAGELALLPLLDREGEGVEQLLRSALEREGLEHLDGAQLLDLPGGWLPVHLFEIKGFVTIEAEDVRERTISFAASCAGRRDTLLAWVHCDGHRYRFFYGNIPPARSTSTERWLKSSLEAFFPGSTVNLVDEPTADDLREGLKARRACAAITGIPSERAHTPVEARLDEALDGLTNIPFDLILLAEPVPRSDQLADLRGLLDLSNFVASLARSTVIEQQGEVFQQAVRESAREAMYASDEHVDLDHSEHAEVRQRQENLRQPQNNAATAAGAILGAIAGAALAAPTGPAAAAAAAKGAAIGGAVGNRLASAMGPKETLTTTDNKRKAKTHSERRGSSREEAEEFRRETSERIARELTITRVNQEAHHLEALLEKHLERRQTGSGVGMWWTSVHVLAGDAPRMETVCSVLSGALRGDQTHLEPLRWVPYAEPQRAIASLADLQVPLVHGPPHPLYRHGNQLPTALTTYEVAHWLRPPARELAGFTVRPPLHFGRTPPASGDSAAGRVRLGTLIYRGQTMDREPVHLSTKALASHALLVGTTGAGKTTTARGLLWGLQHLEVPVPFMVIEPAKSEYRDLYRTLEAAGRRPIRLVAGQSGAGGLHINPLQAPQGLPLGRHVDWVRTLLLSCFTLDASMPQIIERVLLDAFERAGLSDLQANYTDASPPCPGLADLDGEVPDTTARRGEQTTTRVYQAVHDLGYRGQPLTNLAAAVTTRLGSLLSGPKRQVLLGEEPDWTDLLARPVFIELSDIVAPDVRQLVMGALVGRLYGIREAQARAGAASHAGLRHLLVLEEAHHLIRKPEGHTDTLARQLNGQLSSAFAELRAYGQGILVADQAPDMLDPSVIRNTNVKLVHRLLYDADCRAVGDSMGLDAEGQATLRRLATGEALLFQGGMPSPLHTRVDEWTEPHGH
jgi:uncharacterized protein YcfJ